jgi:hypothetical protein
MNKGYAFGFLIVLLVIILGLYVAFTGFMSSRETLRAEATAVPTARQAEVAIQPTEPILSTATPTIMVLPTPVPGITATLTAVASPEVETAVPQPTEPAQTSPTEPPPPTPTQTPLPVTQPPTPAPVPAYAFRLAAPPSPDPNYSLCCYIFGTVRDAAGNPLEGVQVQAFNEWNTLPPAMTKGGGEAGQYNIPIGNEPVTWYVMVVDASGNQISTQVPIQFSAEVALGYRVDWQRTY